MIALDTSAMVAIAFHEDDAERFAALIGAEQTILVGTPTLLELRLVLGGRFGGEHLEEAMDLAVPTNATIIPFDQHHLAAAADAQQRFGGRPARLNFGDCMAYAVAAVARCPLLYKGEDFARTDIRSALA